MKQMLKYLLVVGLILGILLALAFLYTEARWPFSAATGIKAYGDITFGMNERDVNKLVAADQFPFDLKSFELENQKNLFIDLCYANNVVPYSYNPFSYLKGGKELVFTTQLFGHTAVVFYRFLKNRLVRVDFAVLARENIEDLVKQMAFFKTTIMHENYNYIDPANLYFNSLNNKIGAVLMTSFGAEKKSNKMVYFINSVSQKGKTLACLVGKNYWADFYQQEEKHGTVQENNPFE